MEKKRGHYLGTEIEGKWWRRYMRDGFWARGNGEYWYDEGAFYFRRYLTRDPLSIPLSRLREVQLGRWHAGRWAWGAPIVKLIWEHDGLSLISGFVLSREESQAQQMVQDLERQVALLAQDRDAEQPLREDC
jgi:hypothetical protein